MFTRINDRIGSASMVVAVIALIAALSGAAYAAKGGLTAKQKKEVKKIAMQFAGKPGAPGATGPTGPAGATGTKGDKGDKGDPGAGGAPGKSVAVGTATALECPSSDPAGGATVEVAEEPATKKKICNGKPGEEGDPWTAGGTLPSAATETGAWVVGTGPSGARRFAISFFLPLAVPLVNDKGVDEEGCSVGANPECKVHYIDKNGKEWLGIFGTEEKPKSAACDGTAAAPTADPGHLCIYAGAENSATHSSNEAILQMGDGSETSGASTAGAIAQIELTSSAGFAYGSWAVTAP